MKVLAFLVPILILLTLEALCLSSFRPWVKTLSTPLGNVMKGFYILCTLLFWAFLFAFPVLREVNEPRMVRALVSIFVMAITIGKLFMCMPILLDFAKRGIFYIIHLFYPSEAVPAIVKNGMSRSEFLKNVSLLLGGSMFGLMLYGAANRYRYKLRNIQVPLGMVPESIKKLKIIQISDIHSGSFTSVKDVQAGVDMINAQNPDIIFFTGDLVNNESTEMRDYESVFNQLQARYGIYSILGNHDYGDYISWDSTEAKVQNLENLKSIHQRMGWRLLLNENVTLDIGGHKLGIIGVENISGKGFRTYGDLNKAMNGLDQGNVVNILLSHDPSHWDTEVRLSDLPIHLTLSGHTHGLQFGIEIPGLKWSPVQYLYKQWAGLYNEGSKFIYVNRGFGFLGYPGRVGILPEITSINLA